MAKEWACKCGHINDPSETGFNAHKCSSCGKDKWLIVYLAGSAVAVIALLVALVVFMLGQPASAYKAAYERFYKNDQAASEQERADLDKLAKRYRLTLDKRQSLEAEVKSKLGVTEASNRTNECGLTPAKVPDVAKLLQYLKQGMNYASQRQYESVLAEFRPLLNIDPNFLGAHQNVGAAYIALKRYDDAEKEVRQELKLIGCLEPMSDDQLSKFAYMIDPAITDGQSRAIAQGATYRTRLTHAKAAAHYNLACIFSQEKKSDESLAELRAAIDSGFTNARQLRGDPDLTNVRKSAGFPAVLAAVH